MLEAGKIKARIHEQKGRRNAKYSQNTSDTLDSHNNYHQKKNNNNIKERNLDSFTNSDSRPNK